MEIDLIGPKVRLTTQEISPAAVSVFPVTAAFSEAVTFTDLAVIQIQGGSASNLQEVSPGTVFSFDVTAESVMNVYNANDEKCKLQAACKLQTLSPLSQYLPPHHRRWSMLQCLLAPCLTLRATAT